MLFVRKLLLSLRSSLMPNTKWSSAKIVTKYINSINDILIVTSNIKITIYIFWSKELLLCWCLPLYPLGIILFPNLSTFSSLLLCNLVLISQSAPCLLQTFKIKIFVFLLKTIINILVATARILETVFLLILFFSLSISLYDNLWIQNSWGQILDVTWVYPNCQCTTGHRPKMEWTVGDNGNDNRNISYSSLWKLDFFLMFRYNESMIFNNRINELGVIKEFNFK